MRRIHRFIHVARITAAANLRISNLGLPNVEMELPAAAQLPADALALYVTISGEVLNRQVVREGRGILRSCFQREYTVVILDMNLVRTADCSGLRWLAQLKQTADWYNVGLLMRLSPTLALVVRSTGLPFQEFMPSSLKGAVPALSYP